MLLLYKESEGFEPPRHEWPNIQKNISLQPDLSNSPQQLITYHNIIIVAKLFSI